MRTKQVEAMGPRGAPTNVAQALRCVRKGWDEDNLKG